MTTEVLLLQDVENLGAEGELVTVSDGYARNFLVPREIAAPATAATRRRLAKLQEQREEERRVALDAARGRAKSLDNLSITIKAKTSGEEKLYGSVGETEIAEALTQQGHAVTRQDIELDSAIKELGVYDAVVRLHPEVGVGIKVWVVED